MPNTRYQGSKRKIIDKIFHIVCKYITPVSILDLFDGSAICSLYFQLNNINIIYNDLLKFNCINSHGFLNIDIKNIPTENEIENIFEKKDDTVYKTFVKDNFKDVYYTDKENLQLDIFNTNIHYYTKNIKKI